MQVVVDLVSVGWGLSWFLVKFAGAFLFTALLIWIMFYKAQAIFQPTFDEVCRYLERWNEYRKKTPPTKITEEQRRTDAFVFIGCCILASILFSATSEVFMFIYNVLEMLGHSNG